MKKTLFSKGTLQKPSRETLQGMTFTEMSKAEYLAYCKENYADLYNAKFKETFGYEPGQKPRERIGNKPMPILDAPMIQKLNSSTWDELAKADLLEALSQLPAMFAEKFKGKFGKYPDGWVAPAAAASYQAKPINNSRPAAMTANHNANGVVLASLNMVAGNTSAGLVEGIDMVALGNMMPMEANAVLKYFDTTKKKKQ